MEQPYAARVPARRAFASVVRFSGLGLFAAVALPLGATCALPDAEKVQRMPVQELKAAYLACARDSSDTRMDQLTAELCQQVAHVLQVKAFGGDLERQLAWWRDERDRRAALGR